MPAQVTSKQIARKFPGANLSALPTSNPGGGKPWLSGSGSIVVGAFAGGGNFLPLAGGTITGEVFIASGGRLYLYDASAEADVSISVDDGYLLVGGTPLLDNNSTLDASKLGVGTVPDDRLSANVARRDQANTFVGGQTVSGVINVGTISLGAGTKSAVAIQLGTGGPGYGIYSSNNGTTPGLGFAIAGTSFIYTSDANSGINVHSLWAYGWGSGAADSSMDTRFTRNSAGVVNLGTTSDNALGSLNLANLTASGNIDAGGSAFYVSAGTGRTTIYNAGALGWTAAGTANTSMDTSVSRVSAGILQIGTTSNNALGSLNLAGLTASGMIIANGGIDLNSSAVFRRSSFFVWRNTAVGKHSFRNWVETSGVTLDYSTDGVLNLRNRDDSGAGNLTCGWVDAAHRPYTFAGLPLASAAQDKTFVCTDSTLAMTSANYGSTPGGGGSNRVRVFSNGTAWLLA